MPDFKDLLNSIKCGTTQSIIFDESDLAKVKACLPDNIAPDATDLSIKIPQLNQTCINDGLNQVNKLFTDQVNNQATVIELSTIKGKIEEALDHYTFILDHYSERVKFFNDTISAVEPFTSEHIYYTDEYTRLLDLERSIYRDHLDFQIRIGTSIQSVSDQDFLTIKSDFSNLSNLVGSILSGQYTSNQYFKQYYDSRLGRIEAQTLQEVAKQGSIKALSAKIDKLTPLPIDPILSTKGLGKIISSSLSSDNLAKLELQGITNQFSTQLTPIFGNEVQSISGIQVPARTSAFSIKLIGLDSLSISTTVINPDNTSTVVNKDIKISKNSNLTKKPFNSTIGEYCIGIKPDSKPLIYSNYDKVKGDLYTELYKKLRNPIFYLYTLEERGLSVNPDQVDPALKSVKDAPTTITEDQKKYYIASQERYSSFYESLQKSMPERIKKERNINFPKQIAKTISKLKLFAQREVADQFRKISDSSLKLARVTNYRAGASTVFSQGNFKYSNLDQALSSTLSYYLKAESELIELIAVCNSQISDLQKKIDQNTITEDSLKSGIGAIPCFKDAVNFNPVASNCESETLNKKGKDPLFIRTMDSTDASLPDMNSSCYWREFANSLNKIAILPIPDISAPIFRYYPINNLIPTPIGIILVPIPQKWKTLFVLSSSIGTLVMFLVMPIAIVGIPLPSIYAMYLAPDGRKYMVFAPNIPLLYGNPLLSPKYGFEPDMSSAADNPTGLVTPFSGNQIKGALSLPIEISAKSTKSTRLLKVASDLALGKTPQIKTRAGMPIGGIDTSKYLELYTSPEEKILKAINDSNGDIERQIKKFKRNLNHQFDRLGPVKISAITELKAKTRNSRESAVLIAEAEPDSPKRRKAKELARSLDPVSLNHKIEGVLSDFNNYIDKIKLGTIVFPDDTTKLNPKVPPAITAFAALIEQAATGGLKLDSGSSNLITKLKKMASTINLSDLNIKQTSFDLRKESDFESFKKAMKDYSKLAMDYVIGKKSKFDKVSPNLSKEQKAKIAKSNELRKQRLKKALAFTSLTAPTIKLFDPSAPCCQVKTESIDLSLSPQAFAAVSVFNALFDAYLSGLTPDLIAEALGQDISNISISTISVFFNSIINSFPNIDIPNFPNIAAISQAIILPILAMLNIPQAPNPLGIPFPIQVKIPLDALIKPLLKATIAYLLELIMRLLSDAGGMLSLKSSDSGNLTYETLVKQIPCGNSEFAMVSTTNNSNHVSVTLPNGFQLNLPKIPGIPLDLIGYFALLTGTDLTELIRNLLNAAIDGILQPLKDILSPIMGVMKSLKGLSFNILEASNPLVSIIKLAIMAIELQIPNGTKFKLANLDAINLIKASYIPVITATEPVVKEVAYLGSVIACALAGGPGVLLARTAASPFFNQDDLPPWERLTHKNPLFAIFLDEIAWRSSLTSTGSLLFQTKMPGLYPMAWVPSIFIDTGALYHPVK